MKISRMVEGVSSFGGAVSSVAVLLMTALILLEVVLRSFTGVSLLICEEYAAYLLVVFGSMALGYALKSGAHIRVDLLLSRFAPTPKRVVDLCCAVAGFLVLAYVAVQSWDQCYGSLTSGQTSMYFSKTPLWVPQVFMVLGTGVMALQFAVMAARLIRDFWVSLGAARPGADDTGKPYQAER